jgi:hypothetical protein
MSEVGVPSVGRDDTTWQAVQEAHPKLLLQGRQAARQGWHRQAEARPGRCEAAECDSAWKKGPLGGVIGVQKGPLC